MRKEFRAHAPIGFAGFALTDIWVLNSRKTLDLRMETKVIMTYFGKGYWSRYGMFETACSINSQKYPFDEQECYYELDPGFSNSIHMTMDTGNLDIILDYYEQNEEWELKSGKTYITYKKQLQRIRYVLLLKRRSILILLSMVIPTTLISLTGTLCFILPTESDERLTLVISIALAIILYI